MLIANRGEIALRVVRACHEAGLRCTAVYSEADRGALHVRHADDARLLGPPEPAGSYLHVERLLAAARESGCDAVHPGYGFLAENAGFAQACLEAGLTFIGPPVEAIRLLGDKAEARRTMGRAGIPLVPGTPPLASPEAAVAAAREIGFPLLVKASGGGGGRGIRQVDRLEDLAHAVEIASSEALQAFGDPRVYLERLLAPVRHIEVQVMADAHGNTVALGERECSLQRRHQKLVEEGPSVAVTPRLRKELMDAAVTAARTSGYLGAGTVEFLLDASGRFYFLEVNTRLQVEHPVTELITGQDLVQDQLRVAAGEPLPYRQEDIELRGWAIECRILAEDASGGFVPSTGRARVLQEPGGPGIRLDSGLYDGQEITPYYDSLLAKLISWGRDREEALRRMRRALDEYQITGVKTAIPFDRYVLTTPQFIEGDLHTGLVEELLPGFEEEAAHRAELAAVASAVLATAGMPKAGPAQAAAPARGRSSWAATYGPRPGVAGWSR